MSQWIGNTFNILWSKFYPIPYQKCVQFTVILSKPKFDVNASLHNTKHLIWSIESRIGFISLDSNAGFVVVILSQPIFSETQVLLSPLSKQEGLASPKSDLYSLVDDWRLRHVLDTAFRILAKSDSFKKLWSRSFLYNQKHL